MTEWKCTQVCFKQNCEAESDYSCDSGGCSGDLEKSDLICQSPSSLVLTSNYSMFVELKILIWFTYLYSIIGQTEMHKPLLSRGKVKTRDARTCVFCVLENDTLQAYIGYYLLLGVTEWEGAVPWSISLPAPFIQSLREKIFQAVTTVDTGPQAVKSFFVGWGVDLHLKSEGITILAYKLGPIKKHN